MVAGPRLEDVHDLAVRDNPAEYYTVLREGPPVFIPEVNSFLVTKYDTVRHILGDHQNFTNGPITLLPKYEISGRAIGVLAERGIFGVPGTTAGGDEVGEQKDQSDHAIGHRAIMATGLFRSESPMVTEIISRRADQVMDNLDKQIAASGDSPQEAAVDIMDLAGELTQRVNMDILGADQSRYSFIQKASEGQIALTWSNTLDEDEQVAAAEGLADLWDESLNMITSRLDRLQAGEQFDALPVDMSSMLAKMVNEGKLTTEQAASIVLNILVAGFETTKGSIGNAVLHTLKDGNWHELAVNSNNPEYVRAYVEEYLRLHPSIKAWWRRAETDVVIDGVPIPAGSNIMLQIAASNRDERQFTDGNSFDPNRSLRETLSHNTFGYGIHRCVGAPIARQELRVILPRLASAYPDAKLAPGFADQPGIYQENAGFYVPRQVLVVPGPKAK